MKFSKKITMLGAVLGMVAAAQADDIQVQVNKAGAWTNTGWVDASGNMTASHTMVSANNYRLNGQIYVTNAATLTVQAGTHIINNPSQQGSIVITRGCKIYCLGTASAPVVWTADDGVNQGESATDHLGTQLWGNITILGQALISASHTNASGTPVNSYNEGAGSHTNTLVADGMNKNTMEGLSLPSGDSRAIYGGSNDDDDSGTLTYVSLRYGGRNTASPNSELNGLSMGAIGRNTDVNHIDIWNNIDDGIETWGGTVNYKYINIWNIGDDSFDFDEGWRGKAQFVFIVQGYGKTDAEPGSKIGSGQGDHMLEMDGAERADAQPVTTGCMYNVTGIGQPYVGTNGTAWRDNTRMQIRNSVFMDISGQLIVEEASESTTGNAPWGYGENTTGGPASGTLTWAQTWATSYTAHSTVNEFPGYVSGDFNDPAEMYLAQSAGDPSIGQGKLAEMTDCVFFDVGDHGYGSGYTTSDAVGVTSSGASNAAKGNVVASSSPIVQLSRLPLDPDNSVHPYQNVDTVDPRAQNDAATSISAAPADGFFTPAYYRGAFSPNVNWALGWTAASDYNKFSSPANPANPSATVALVVGTSFQTESGKSYVVESSTDNVNWSPVGTVQGDGTIKNLADFATIDSAKVYRVTVQ